MTSKALRDELHCQKEYCLLFAEKENAKHVHLHVIAIPEDLPTENRGANIFSLLGVPEEEAVPRAKVINLCESLSHRINIQ